MRYASVALCCLLAACSNPLARYEAGTYVVQPGDTLYAIAWRHGLDPRLLASWNQLSDPDLIRVGQRLVLRPASVGAAGRPGANAPARPQSVGRTLPPPNEPPPMWQWPTEGPVVDRFGTPQGLTSGIGIGGRHGQPVRAAAPGRVVYAGSGLIGYGQLVIVKHNETYLSAYGYNSRLLVGQGEEVRRGQVIAEMGYGPAREPRLHFEIRRNGAPVDPLEFLRPVG